MKKNLVVYCTHCNDGFAPTLDTHASFSEMREAAIADGIPANILAETAAALGEAFEIELDI